jgi:hypothetical protein
MEAEVVQMGAMLGLPGSLYSAMVASPAVAWTGFSGSASGESTLLLGSLSAAVGEGTAQTDSTTLGRAQTDGLAVVAVAEANTEGNMGWNAIDLAVAVTGSDVAPVPSGSVSAEAEAQTASDELPIADTSTSIQAFSVYQQTAESAAEAGSTDQATTLDLAGSVELPALFGESLPQLQVSDGTTICFAPIPDAWL